MDLVDLCLNLVECPDAQSRLDYDVKRFNETMPSAENIQRVKLRDVPFEKTTTMKIKRYLLAAHAETKKKEREKCWNN